MSTRSAPEVLPEWSEPVLVTLSPEQVAGVRLRARERCEDSVLARLSVRGRAPSLADLRALLNEVSSITGVPAAHLLVGLVRAPDGGHLPSLGGVSSRLGALCSILGSAHTLAAVLEIAREDDPTFRIRTRAGWISNLDEFWHLPRTRSWRIEHGSRLTRRLRASTRATVVLERARSLAPRVCDALGQLGILDVPPEGLSPVDSLRSGEVWEAASELDELLATLLLPPVHGAWSWDPNRGDPWHMPRWADDDLPETRVPTSTSEELHEALRAEFATPPTGGDDHGEQGAQLSSSELSALAATHAPLGLGDRFWAEFGEASHYEFQVVSADRAAAVHAHRRTLRALRNELCAAAVAAGELPKGTRGWDLERLDAVHPAASRVLELALSHALDHLDAAGRALVDLDLPEDLVSLAAPDPAAAAGGWLTCVSTDGAATLPADGLGHASWSAFQTHITGETGWMGRNRWIGRDAPAMLRELGGALRDPHSRPDAIGFSRDLLRAAPEALLLGATDLLVRSLLLREDARDGLMNSAWARSRWLAPLAPPRSPKAAATRARIEATLAASRAR